MMENKIREEEENMINSNPRRLALSGWLKDNFPEIYNSPLRLQKFLFLYEALSKVNGIEADFSGLKGYVKGPVFSVVWGDYTKEKSDFNIASNKAYLDQKEKIDKKSANIAGFVVRTHTEEELSQLTHQYHIWYAKKEKIFSGEKNVPLNESDFNTADYGLTKELEKMFPEELAYNSRVFNFGNKYFVFNNSDVKCITEQHIDTLSLLADNEELCNPVYVTIEEGGRLLVD